MIKIREQVFETNSSSAHSVYVRWSDNAVFEYDSIMSCVDKYLNELEIELGCFGWDIYSYSDAYTKLQYALTMVYETEVPFIEGKDQSAFYETDGYNEILSLIHDKCGVNKISIKSFDGYIDHQSYEDYNSLNDFLNDYGVTLEEFIFCPNVILHTDNDNH